MMADDLSREKVTVEMVHKYNKKKCLDAVDPASISENDEMEKTHY